MVEFEVDMGYLEEYGELDCVILYDENGEMEPQKFIPAEEESKDYLKEIYNWSYSNMECCDEPEWSLFSGIADVIAKYWREIEFNKLFKDSKYENDDIAF